MTATIIPLHPPITLSITLPGPVAARLQAQIGALSLEVAIALLVEAAANTRVFPEGTGT